MSFTVSRLRQELGERRGEKFDARLADAECDGAIRRTDVAGWRDAHLRFVIDVFDSRPERVMDHERVGTGPGRLMVKPLTSALPPRSAGWR